MKISKKIKKFVKRKDVEALAEKGAQNVQAILEQEEGEEAYKKATETAIEEIKKHPELAIKILTLINEKISSEIAVNTVIQLPKEEDFSEETTKKATEELSLEDNHIIAIIQESDLGYKDSMEITQQLSDEEIKKKVQQKLKKEEEQRSLSSLKQIYKKCNEEMNEAELEEELNKAMVNININTEKIQELKNRIIAKKIALNYATYGTNIVSKQRTLISAKQMYEANMVEMAKEEYKKIEEETATIKGEKIKKFNEQELRYKILREIEATEVSTKFNEEETLNEIISIMKTTLKESERKAILIRLKEEVTNEKIRKTYESMKKTGITKILSELPENKREDVLEILKNVTSKRLKVAEKTPKLKTSEFINKDER